METGFLNPIHDEEHFSSSFYNQGNGLEDSDHMLFGEMIVPEVVDLWSIEDMEGHSQTEEGEARKEDFQKMLYEWQQLTSMQETEVKKPEEINVKPVEEALTEETATQETVVFPNRTSTPSLNPPVPSIDELFPLEPVKDTPSTIDLDKDLWSQYLVESPAQETKPAEEIKPKEKPCDIKVEPGYIKTGLEDVPLLLNKDLTSLLEEFEATEEKPEPQPSPASPARPSSKTIRDALPPEVISRIKATRESHKKMISVVPVMRSKRTARPATRMQDAAAALSRNKLLKLVTGGSGGETVQLDHDYCTNGEVSSGSRSYYVSDCSDYPSQSSTPDYSRKLDSGSIKDSGMESADNSEDDFPVKEPKCKPVKNKLVGKSISVMTEKGIIVSNVSTPMKTNIPMVSVLKKKEPVTNKKVDKNVGIEDIMVDEEILKNIKIEKEEAESNLSAAASECDAVGKKKRKLNLEEYRVRREEREKMRSQESSRANSPCPTPPIHIQPDSTTATTTTTTATATDGAPQEKPLMLSVEVQTQTCDLIDLTSESNHDKERSRTDRKDKRHDLKHRSYRSRRASSSSSSSSRDSDRRSHRRKKSSRRNRHHRNSVSRMWSRSRSRSRSRSSSRSQSVDRSRSRSRDRRRRRRSRSPRRHSRHSNNHWDNRDRWQRSRSPVMRRERPPVPEEKNRQVEERRVIYVGRIEEGISKADLRLRFQQFGPIVDISVHFRERGDNYGFVTFAHKADAYKAVEHGNDDPTYPHYDLCFGGRRAFCKQRYADLDGLATTVHNQYGPPPPPPQPRSDASFDLLLHQMKSQMRKRSSV